MGRLANVRPAEATGFGREASPCAVSATEGRFLQAGGRKPDGGKQVTEPKRLIIDTNGTLEEMLGIVYALKSAEAKVEAITTGAVTDEEREGVALLSGLAARLRPEAPPPVVLRGADKPLLRRTGAAGATPTDSGTETPAGAPPVGGDAQTLPWTDEAGETRPAEETAAARIVRLADAHPGELTLVTLGRLTNAALAVALDPALPSKLKRHVALGGTVRAPGNATPVAERNFRGDPDAAAYVIRAGMPVTLVGLDATMRVRLTRERWRTQLGMSELVRHLVQASFEASPFESEAPVYAPLAVDVALHPAQATLERMKIAIETKGALSAGAVIADLRSLPREGREIDVCTDVPAEPFLCRWLRTMAGGEEPDA